MDGGLLRAVVVCLFAVGAFGVAAAQAEEEPAKKKVRQLTVDRAVKMALERKSFGEAAEAAVQAEQAGRRTAMAWPNPELNYDREQVWEGGETAIDDFVFLEQTLPIWGVRGLRAEAAERQARAVKSANDEARQERTNAVKAAFYRYLRWNLTFHRVEDWEERVEALVDTLEKRQKSGEASALELQRMRQNLDEARSEAASIRAELQSSRGDLAALVGENYEALANDWDVRGDVLPEKVPNLDDLRARLKVRPDIESLRTQAEAEELTAAAAARDVIPTPTLRGGYRRVVGGGVSSHGYLAGVTIPLPALNQNKGERTAAMARKTRLDALADLRLNQEKARLEGDYRAAMERLDAAREFRKQAIPRAQKLLQRAESRQASGEGSLFGLLEAHRALYEAQVKAIELDANARQAVIELESRAGY